MKGAKSGAAALARASPAAHRSDFCFPAGSQAPSRGLASAPRSDSQHGDLSRSSHPLSPRLPVACHQKQTKKHRERRILCLFSFHALCASQEHEIVPRLPQVCTCHEPREPGRAQAGRLLLQGGRGRPAAPWGRGHTPGGQRRGSGDRAGLPGGPLGRCPWALLLLGSLGTPKSFGWIGKRGRRRVRAGKPCG